YLPRLFLDHWLPVLLGWLCGLAKRRARITETKESYPVSSLFENAPLIYGSFQPRGKLGLPEQFPYFEALREVFEMPLVTHTPFGFLCLNFQWDLEAAQMQAIKTEVSIASEFLPGLPLGRFRLDGIDEKPMGSFRLDVPWKLSRPFLASALHPRQHFGLIR